jgi:hypothetical protein
LTIKIAAAHGTADCYPVTSDAVAIGRLGWRTAARPVGCVAAVAMAVVGCTTVTDGAPSADNAIAPAYRASVSASVSASAATSSAQETRRQQSLTTKAVLRACESFIASNKEAVDRVNDFITALNNNRDASGAEGPAIDALNHSADTIDGDNNGPLSQELHEALNSYTDAARDLAGAIRSHPGPDALNKRIDQLNDARGNALKRCRASL